MRQEQTEWLYIYLSGSIKKGDQDNRDERAFWSDEEEKQIIEGVKGVKVRTLNPAKSNIRRSDYYANFGCDLHLVSISDIVLVDARTHKGIGIGAEMMFAQMRGIRTITICPHNSNYRRDFLPNVFGEDIKDWIHPFIFGLSDYIVDRVEDAIGTINSLIAGGLPPKPVNNMQQAIDYYNRIRETL